MTGDWLLSLLFLLSGAEKEAKTFFRTSPENLHQLLFIHSCVPMVASGKAERSGAENEPRDIHPLPNHPLYGVS